MVSNTMVPQSTCQLIDSLTSAIQQFEQNPGPVHASTAIAELKRILLLHIDGLEDGTQCKQEI